MVPMHAEIPRKRKCIPVSITLLLLPLFWDVICKTRIIAAAPGRRHWHSSTGRDLVSAGKVCPLIFPSVVEARFMLGGKGTAICSDSPIVFCVSVREQLAWRRYLCQPRLGAPGVGSAG